MKNLRVLPVLFFIGFFLIAGCNLSERLEKAVDNSNIQVANLAKSNSNSDANKTLSEKAADEILDEKVGIPECDNLIESFAAQDKKENEGYLEKARRQFLENKIREELKKNIKVNRNNKKAMATTCLQLKEQLDAFKPEAEDETNANES